MTLAAVFVVNTELNIPNTVHIEGAHPPNKTHIF